MLIRLIKWLFGAALLAALLAAAWDVASYEPKAWRSDFDRLKHDMAQGYANLDWSAQHRGLDVAALARRTERDLDRAHSRLRGWFALKRFIEAFNDPHFRVEDRKPQASGSFVSSAQRAQPVPAGKDCASSGYKEGDHGFAFPWERVPGWRVVADGNFPAGVAGATGVLRIAQFGENRYLSACERTFRQGLSEHALRIDTRRLLQAELRQRIAGLRKAGARRIIVDLTGNGGGTEWVEEAVALFTARTLTRPPTQIVGPACDRSAIWQGHPPPCAVFRPAPAVPAKIAGTGEWNGAVLVLVDRNTASASEDFANWIKDGGVGRILGERTTGAGCGFIDGGTRTALSVLPVDVRMPNCARFMRNGLNEIEGIPPDVALPMDDPEKAAAALGRLLAGR